MIKFSEQNRHGSKINEMKKQQQIKEKTTTTKFLEEHYS